MDIAPVVVLVVLGIAISLAIAGYRSSLKKQQYQQAIQQALLTKQMEEAQATIDRMQATDGDISKLPDLTAQARNLVLHVNEKCFALCRGAQHVVEAHRTKYVGGSHGVSVRITKGMRYHIGGFSGRPVTTYYEKVQDTGDLYVTTQRVVFAGSREVSSIAGKKIADVRVDGDHIWVLTENRKTPLGLKLTVPLAAVMGYSIRMLAEHSASGN